MFWFWCQVFRLILGKEAWDAEMERERSRKRKKKSYDDDGWNWREIFWN